MRPIAPSTTARYDPDLTHLEDEELAEDLDDEIPF